MRSIRYAVRGLRRSPLLAAAAVVSLSLGIAATTVVFGLLDAAILRQPPFPAPERIAVLNIVHTTPSEGTLRVRWSWRRFRLLEQSARSFDAVTAFGNAVLTLTGVDDPEPVQVELVSSGYHGVVGVTPTAGTALPMRDDEPAGSTPAVLIGHRFWQRRFAGATSVVGRTLQLNGVTLTIAGIMPRGFAGISGIADAWVPATMAPRLSYADFLVTNQNFISAAGRLRAGVSIDDARRELAVLGQRIQQEEPSEAETSEDRFSATATILNQARSDPATRRALLLLLGAVGVLLLIACANVASLLLGRAVSRRREIAIRLSLGATRGALVRQLLVEGAVLAAAAGAIGALASAWAMRVAQLPPALSRGRNFYGAIGQFAAARLDARVLAFSVGVCAATVLIFALVPALRATRADLVTDLRSGAPRSSASSGWRLGLRESVVSLQVALAIVLLVSGGLLLASFQRLRGTPLGFDPRNLLTFMIRPSEVRYAGAAAPRLIDRVLEEVARVPGVVAATVDGCAPLTAQCANAPMYEVGKPRPAPGEAPDVLRHYVAPDHFRTLGIAVRRGRGLTDADRAGSPHVVVINELAARRFWPGENPIGRRVWFDANATYGSPDSSAEIVGIVADMAYQVLDEHPLQPDFFTPYAQFTYPSRMVLVRTRSDPLTMVTPIAQAVRRADRDLALFDVRTMEQRAGLSWAAHTFRTTLLSVFAAVALLLAATGIYAVTAHFVASRTRELGIRIALGASDAQVVRASASRTIRLAAVGVVAGVASALLATRLLESLLYDTSPLDPRGFGGALAVLLAIVALATYVPVRRALKADPMEALRAE